MTVVTWADNLDFPLPATETSWAFLHGLVGVVYGNVTQRGKGLVELVMAALK
jgi:hypothetical protein